jgi:hypothetical protein
VAIKNIIVFDVYFLSSRLFFISHQLECKSLPINTDLSSIYAHIFFVDIIGLSDPIMSTKTQVKKIRALNQCILECDVYKLTPQDLIFVLPTGDGMLIGFLNGLELPLHLAIQLQKKLAEYNKPKIPSEVVKVRIGLHSGNIFVVEDIQHNKNVWGPGTIIARRIMDLGNENHILMSSRMAEDLMELSDEYRQIIHPLGNVEIKHGQTMIVFSAFGEDFGNPNTIIEKEKMITSLKEEKKVTVAAITRKEEEHETLLQRTDLQKIMIYSYVGVALAVRDIDNETLVHYRRTYEVTNISGTPVGYVFHGITTDIPKSFHELNLRVYDEYNHDLEITKILMDEPYQKEFVTIFRRPVLKGEHLRYTMEYDLEEPNRYFENAFLTDCKKFVLTFEYPQSSSISVPIVYEVNQETDEKKKPTVAPSVNREGNHCLLKWAKDNVVKGQTFGIEW